MPQSTMEVSYIDCLHMCSLYGQTKPSVDLTVISLIKIMYKTKSTLFTLRQASTCKNMNLKMANYNLLPLLSNTPFQSCKNEHIYAPSYA